MPHFTLDQADTEKGRKPLSIRQITIPVRLDAKTFRRFGWFDTFRLRRRWVRPAIFAAIMLAFAAVALFSKRPQSGLIAGVLGGVGIVLPAVYVGSFLAQLNAQIRLRKLDTPRRVYTVKLDFDGLRVSNDQRKEGEQFVKWQDAFAAYRAKDCVYLYVSPVKCFLLPDGQADVSDDELWDYLTKRMGEKCRG